MTLFHELEIRLGDTYPVMSRIWGIICPYPNIWNRMKSRTNRQPIVQIGICQTPISQTPISFCTHIVMCCTWIRETKIHMKEPAEPPDLTSQSSQFLWSWATALFYWIIKRTNFSCPGMTPTFDHVRGIRGLPYVQSIAGWFPQFWPFTSGKSVITPF